MKRASLVGIVAVVVYVVGQMLLGPVPGGGDANAEDFQKFYVTDDKTGLAIFGVLVLTLGCIGLFFFFHEMHARFDTKQSRAGLVSVAVGLGLVAAGAGILAGPSGVQFNSDEAFVGQPVAHALAQSGYAVMLIGGGMFIGLGVAIFAFEGRRLGAFLPWVAIIGIVAAALQLLAYFWIPMFAIPLWVLIVAITWLTSKTAPSTTDTPVRAASS
jgi:hypothetical protein